MKSIYLIGSLANRIRIPALANRIEKETGIEAFCDWISPGEEADRKWAEYERAKGRTYRLAINGPHAWHIFNFDKFHLDRCDASVLIMPCGKSGHIEFGYSARSGKPTFVLFEEEPDHYDLMYRFATDLFYSDDAFIEALKVGADREQ